jgi:DNA-binding transcriptional LysR family regulator
MSIVTMEWESRLGRRLRIRDVYILATVVKSGSMAKAASLLAMSQPAVSEAVANLEHILRVRLLDRSPRGVEPTIYADALLKRGVTVFDELRQGVRDIECLADPTAGQVRIGCAESFMAGLLPAIIEELSLHYPKIVVHVEFAQHATTDFRELRERNVDFILGRVSEPFPHDDLNVENLYEEEYFVVASSRSSWARRRKVALAELINEPWIHMPPDNIISSLVADAFLGKAWECHRRRLLRCRCTYALICSPTENTSRSCRIRCTNTMRSDGRSRHCRSIWAFGRDKLQLSHSSIVH